MGDPRYPSIERIYPWRGTQIAGRVYPCPADGRGILRRRFEVLMVFLITLAAAASSALQEAEYFPLKTGNEWTYSFSNGASMTARVTGTAKVKGVECWVIESEMAGQKTREYLAVGVDGLKAYKMENAGGATEFETALLRAKLPFQKGDTWQFTVQEGAARN